MGYSIQFNPNGASKYFSTAGGQTAATANFERPFTLELRSDRRETSATRVSDDLQISIFRRRNFFFRKTFRIFFSVFHYFRQIFEELGFF